MIIRAMVSRAAAVQAGIVERRRANSVVGALVACAVCWCTAAAAQAPGNYPNRPVRVIVPFAVAGPTDIMARLIAQKLSERNGRQFYVDNVPGAGGNMGMGQAAAAHPDGYTILFVSSSFVVNPSLYATVPYDPVRDFAPVTLAAVTPNLLSVHPSIPAHTVSQLVALIRANPGKYNYASPGAGTTSHLSGELFRLSYALDLVHVPFNGSGPAVAAAVPGHTPIVFAALSPQVPHVKDGKLRALAVTSRHRSSALPEVPTLTELGLDHESETLQGVLVPAGTPKAIANFLHREIADIIAMPDMKARFDAIGFEPAGTDPAEFAAYIKNDIAKWSRIIGEAKLTLH